MDNKCLHQLRMKLPQSLQHRHRNYNRNGNRDRNRNRYIMQTRCVHQLRIRTHSRSSNCNGNAVG